MTKILSQLHLIVRSDKTKQDVGREIMSDVYEIVTREVIKKLEAGTAPWQQPWSVKDSMPMNVRGTPYRGLNVFLLLASGFKSRWWLTYKQVTDLDGQIKQSEFRNATLITFWKKTKVKDRETGEEKEIPFLKYYRVWNLEQIDIDRKNLPKIVQDDLKKSPKRWALSTRLKKAKAIVDGYSNPPEIVEGEFASYSPKLDRITMPPKNEFMNEEEYYSTLFHEMGHSTMHETRVDRKQKDEKASELHNYGKEELVAEMTNAFLSAECEIYPRVIDNQAAYLAGWIKILKSDSRAVVTAAAAAQRAADYILNRENPWKD